MSWTPDRQAVSTPRVLQGVARIGDADHVVHSQQFTQSTVGNSHVRVPFRGLAENGERKTENNHSLFANPLSRISLRIPLEVPLDRSR